MRVRGEDVTTEAEVGKAGTQKLQKATKQIPPQHLQNGALSCGPTLGSGPQHCRRISLLFQALNVWRPVRAPTGNQGNVHILSVL